MEESFSKHRWLWVGKESSQALGRASHGSWDNSRLRKRNGSGHTEVIHEWGTEGFVVHVLEENWEGAIKVIGSPGGLAKALAL